MLAHPATIIPYIPKEEIANIYIIPTFISAKTSLKSIGITAHPKSANANVKIGERTNKNLLQLLGKIVSLVNNFIPSAIGWNKPKDQPH